MIKFRDLTADDIEVRIATVTSKGCSLLLYKDARVDMNVLDEAVGCENWQSRFYDCCGGLFCSVGININFDKQDKDPCWIWKDDSGVEGFSGEIKATASDARKRAGFAWGIGRELYTAPFIWINKDDLKTFSEANGKYTVRDKFSVKKIVIIYKIIKGLAIKNDTTGKIVFIYDKLTDKEKESLKK